MARQRRQESPRTSRDALRDALLGADLPATDEELDLLEAVADASLAPTAEYDILLTARSVYERAHDNKDRAANENRTFLALDFSERMYRELNGVSFRGSQFILQSFAGLKLKEADFSNALFVDCGHEVSAELEKVWQGSRETILTGAVFDEADLAAHDFFNASLDKAEFVKAQLPGCHFDRCLNQQIVGANFKEAVLIAADFNGVRLEDCDLSFAVARTCSMVDATLVACDFSRARLANSAFHGTQFHNCNLDFASLTWATFLPGTKDPRITGTPSKKASAQFADFSNVKFRDMVIANVDLSGSSFAYDDLHAVRFEGCRLVGCNFTSAQVGKATFGNDCVVMNSITEDVEGLEYLLAAEQKTR